MTFANARLLVFSSRRTTSLTTITLLLHKNAVSICNVHVNEISDSKQRVKTSLKKLLSFEMKMCAVAWTQVLLFHMSRMVLGLTPNRSDKMRL